MTAVNIRGRGLGQDGNAPFANVPGASPLGMPSTRIPSAQARAGLRVSRGAGFNWQSMHDERVAARRRMPTVLANALTTRAGNWFPSNLYGTVRTRGSGLGQVITDTFGSGQYGIDASGNVYVLGSGTPIPLGGGTDPASSSTTSSSSGFNWNAFVNNLLGTGLTAFKTSQQADLQSQLLQRGYTLSPTGQVVPVGTSLTGLMPVLLIGGVLVMVMMAGKR